MGRKKKITDPLAKGAGHRIAHTGTSRTFCTQIGTPPEGLRWGCHLEPLCRWLLMADD